MTFAGVWKRGVLSSGFTVMTAGSLTRHFSTPRANSRVQTAQPSSTLSSETEVTSGRPKKPAVTGPVWAVSASAARLPKMSRSAPPSFFAAMARV